MPSEVITEGANVVNKLTDAAPVLGALAIVIIVFGVILFFMQRSQNSFIVQMQSRQEEQLDKTITFVGNYAASMQSERDTTKELSRVVAELNKDCRLRFDRERDDLG